MGKVGETQGSVFLATDEPTQFYSKGPPRRADGADEVLSIILHMGHRKLLAGMTVDVDRDLEEEPRLCLDNVFGEDQDAGKELFFIDALKNRRSLCSCRTSSTKFMPSWTKFSSRTYLV